LSKIQSHPGHGEEGGQRVDDFPACHLPEKHCGVGHRKVQILLTDFYYLIVSPQRGQRKEGIPTSQRRLRALPWNF
jgi:hypothetical protein